MALVFWIVTAIRALIAPAPVAVHSEARSSMAQAPPEAAPLPAPSPVVRPPGSTVEREAWVMGTRLRIVIEGDGALDASEAVLREVERLDAMLSTWTAGSGISAVNGATPGASVRVAPELVEVLAEAEWWADRTGRAFDPTVGPLIEAWDLRGRGRLPSKGELQAALGAVGGDAFLLDAHTGRVERRVAGAWLDSGAFGKGAALRAAARLLRARGVARALVDLGGQLWLVARADAPWSLGVAHPSRRQEVVARLRVSDVSVATSGTSERWVDVAGARRGHILDPRTGASVPAWGSVTVVSPDAFEADVLATALYVMGPVEGLEWARSHTAAGVLFLEERDGLLRATWNAPMERWLDGRPLAARPLARSSEQPSKGTS